MTSPTLRRLLINGRFLSQTVTGAQRYAEELVKALDRLRARKNLSRFLKIFLWQAGIRANI